MNRQVIREHNALFLERIGRQWKWCADLLRAIGRNTTTGGETGWLDELLLTLALGLIVVGLWPIAAKWLGTGLPALIPAGLAILWLAMPSRAPMILRTPPMPEKPARRAN